MSRFTLTLAIAAIVAGCSGDPSQVASSDHPMPTDSPSDQSVPGGPFDDFAPVVDFDLMVGGYWIPTGTLGREFDQVPGAYWAFERVDGEPRITGHDGCNGFDAIRRDDDVPTSFLDGRMTNITTSHALQGCLDPGNQLYPDEGAQFWIDATGGHLVAAPDTQSYVFFERRDVEPTIEPGEPRLWPHEEEALAQQAEKRALEQEAIRARAGAEREQLRMELPIARRRWESAGLRTYELRFEAGCLECPTFPPAAPDGDTVSVVDGATDSPWTAAITGATVDDWFGFLERQLDSAFEVAADFDPVLGFPTDIRYQSRGWSADDEPAPRDDWLFLGAVVVPPPGSPVPGADDIPVPVVELRLDGLGRQAFGGPQSIVEPALTRALGPAEIVQPLDQAPLTSCIRWGCTNSTVLRWPDVGLTVAFSDRTADGTEFPEPHFAAWTVTTADPWWPGEIAVATVDASETRRTFADGLALGSPTSRVRAAFPAALFKAWAAEAFVPTGFYLPDSEGRVTLFGDVDWDVVSELQAALNAQGASLAVDGIAGPSTIAAFTEYRERTGQHDIAVLAFAALGLGGPPDGARVLRLSAGDWFWELDCGALEGVGVANEC